ncbi:MAG: glucose 1-dehydrogenase [Steroidobacteraceae bacterium]|nr:glucose 1-dehydrogenase [Steroidobacteraceae bacterium]MDW8260598.1 glucose 1-dehydrogenase [Gammaproteobacteria bacterium]
MSSLFDLTGQVALISGATRGIGRAIGAAMAQHGARVIVSSESADDCRRVADEFCARGWDAIAIAADVAERAQVERLFALSVEQRRRIDILVCCAGVAPPPGPSAAVSDHDWDRVFNVNLRGAHWLTSLALPAMAERRHGSVILISSIAGLRGNKGLGVYALSKAALAQLARNLSVEWGPSNVRVNAISPGLIQTDFAQPLLASEEFMRRRIAATPLRRVGTPEDIAGVAVMLAAPAGAFITGQNLIVDGGTLIGDGS